MAIAIHAWSKWPRVVNWRSCELPKNAPTHEERREKANGFCSIGISCCVAILAAGRTGSEHALEYLAPGRLASVARGQAGRCRTAAHCCLGAGGKIRFGGSPRGRCG